MSLIILIALYLYFNLNWFGPPASLHAANLNAWAALINGGAWVTVSALMGAAVVRLYAVASQERSPSLLSPMIAAVLYSLGVGIAHSVAWVPIPLAAAILSPIIFMPPLMLLATSRSAFEAPLFSVHDETRIRENASKFPMIRAFLERYPDARAYVYKNTTAYSCGGLLMHSIETMPISQETLIEVTLDCPFAQTPGVMTPGRESFRAYFTRNSASGSIVSILPQTRWEEWLEGIRYLDWMAIIRDMENMRATHPPLNGIPYQLVGRNLPWRQITL